jgi:hypothetical protein
MARRYFPSRMGDMYTEVVITCLECLDKEKGKFSDGIEDGEDGIIIGTRFIQHIISRIDGISL